MQAAVLAVSELCAGLDAAGNRMPCYWMTLQPNKANTAQQPFAGSLLDSRLPLQTDKASAEQALPGSLGAQQAQQMGDPSDEYASAVSSEAQQRDLQSAEHTLGGASAAQQRGQNLSADHALPDTIGAQQQPQSGNQQPLQIGDWSAGSLHSFLLRQAAELLQPSSDAGSRKLAVAYLDDLVPRLTQDGCDAFIDLGIVQKGISLLQLDSERLSTQKAVLSLCLKLHEQDHLPAEHFFEAKAHQQLALMITQSGADHPHLVTTPVAIYCICLMLPGRHIGRRPVLRMTGHTA